MSRHCKAAVFTSISLGVQTVLAMTAFAAPTSPQAPAASGDHVATTLGANELEASFIKVSAKCKTSHAAFEAVRVAIKDISADVRSIHAQIETA